MNEDIKLNEKLKNDILKSIPKDYNNLEKAIYIYYNLCKKLEYSIEYLIEEKKNINYFTNPENIKNVDGHTNKQVVCYTFNAIFLQFLKEANIYNPTEADLSINSEDKCFYSFHKPSVFTIDGIDYIADATQGIFNGNDLSEVKYSNTVSNFKLKEENENNQKILNDAINKVCSDNSHFSSLIEKYIEIKKKDFKKHSLNDRVQIFLKLCTELDEHSVQAFNNILKYKSLIFTKEEMKGSSDFKISNRIENQKIDILFVKDISSYPSEYKCLLFYNPKGYCSDFGKDNLQYLQIFEISPKSKSYKSISNDEFIQKICFGSYVTSKNKKIVNHPNKYPMAIKNLNSFLDRPKYF